MHPSSWVEQAQAVSWRTVAAACQTQLRLREGHKTVAMMRLGPLTKAPKTVCSMVKVAATSALTPLRHLSFKRDAHQITALTRSFSINQFSAAKSWNNFYLHLPLESQKSTFNRCHSLVQKIMQDNPRQTTCEVPYKAKIIRAASLTTLKRSTPQSMLSRNSVVLEAILQKAKRTTTVLYIFVKLVSASRWSQIRWNNSWSSGGLSMANPSLTVHRTPRRSSTKRWWMLGLTQWPHNYLNQSSRHRSRGILR